MASFTSIKIYAYFSQFNWLEKSFTLLYLIPWAWILELVSCHQLLLCAIMLIKTRFWWHLQLLGVNYYFFLFYRCANSANRTKTLQRFRILWVICHLHIDKIHKILKFIPIIENLKQQQQNKTDLYFKEIKLPVTSPAEIWSDQIGSELLLVTRSNDNHSPGPVMKEVSP